jgi:hypothetical protein
VSGWEELQTGDGRPLPVYLKAQIIRELDRLERSDVGRDSLGMPAAPNHADQVAELGSNHHIATLRP